ncbi:MAG: trigger factor [Desulfobacteraceae bacterium IS3]|nr:MAG: trigger factor [Desulfobacteraceae bacterium IS3]
MQVNVEDVSSVKKILHIEIPENEVTHELEEAYDNLRKTAKIKGFRPGKVPRAVLERLYKKNICAEVSAKLIQESFENAVRETNLMYVGNPQIDPPELEEKSPYRYEAMLEIGPVIGNIAFSGLSLKKNRWQVSEEEVEAQISRMKKDLTRQKPLEESRAAQEGDIVLIDYEGFADGKPVPDIRKTENFALKIGAGHIVKEIDGQLAGMNPGEIREISVHFPESHPQERLADRDITFRVNLKEIREEIPMELNEEFAKIFGKSSMDELKDQIRENLKQGYENRSEQEMKEQIFSALIERHEFEVPDVWVEAELEGIIAETERTFSYHNVSMEEAGITREILEQRYRDAAVKQVKRHLILNKIIEQENLTVSDEELELAVKLMADALKKTPEEISTHYKENTEELVYFKHTLLEKQALELIIKSSTVEEVVPESQAPPEQTV